MKSIVIKQVRILDPTSAHHGQVRDLHIINGKIEAIDSHIKAAASTKTLEAEGSCLSPGWMDLQAHFFDPGAEHKEGLENGASAAAHGGFTRTILNASPLVRPDEKSAIAFLQSHSESFNCTPTSHGLCLTEGRREIPLRNAGFSEGGSDCFF